MTVPDPGSATPPRLRAATAGDAAAVAALELASARCEPRLVPLDLSPGQLTRVWQERLSAGQYAVTVAAEASGRLLAFAGFAGPAARGQLAVVYVRPGYFRRGLGRALLRQCLRQAREAGAARVTVHVQPGNAGAQAFYRALGFVNAAPAAPSGTALVTMERVIAAGGDAAADAAGACPGA